MLLTIIISFFLTLVVLELYSKQLVKELKKMEDRIDKKILILKNNITK